MVLFGMWPPTKVSWANEGELGYEQVWPSSLLWTYDVLKELPDTFRRLSPCNLLWASFVYPQLRTKGLESTGDLGLILVTLSGHHLQDGELLIDLGKNP